MSEIKVNKISPRSGTTVTLGDSGDTFTIPSGATINNQGTATNFGATGSASWSTTVKTGDFTAVAGEGYFVDTTSQEIDVALPAGTAGAVIAVKDYANTFDTNQCILVPNGSDKIGGLASSAFLQTEGIAVTLVFIDSTQGWLVTDSGLQSEAPGPQYIAATGGNTTLTVCSHKVHIFTGPGTLCVSAGGNAAGSNAVEYLVIAGGGGSGGYGASGPKIQGAGGGGGGGWRSFTSLPSAAPQNAPAALPVSVQAYPITVGGGGAGDPGNSSGGSRGASSIFSTITSTGGGGGGSKNSPAPACGANKPGGSGGGGAGKTTPQNVDQGGTGNTPPVSPSQGETGGNGARRAASPACESGAGGGGGASVAGTTAPTCSVSGKAGGTGQYVVDDFFGPTAPSYGQGGPVSNTRFFAGGGGGGSGGPGTGGCGGAGGGGRGGDNGIGNENGTDNTGGGAGGPRDQSSKTGGSGIVVIRYKFQT
jgi:hypothetical protein